MWARIFFYDALPDFKWTPFKSDKPENLWKNTRTVVICVSFFSTRIKKEDSGIHKQQIVTMSKAFFFLSFDPKKSSAFPGQWVK